MLTKSHTEPFKYIISNIKKILNSQCVEKEQDLIKRTLKTLTQISNLNQFLTIILDFHWFNRLSLIFQKVSQLIQKVSLEQKTLESYENLSRSPLKTFDQNRQILLKGTKKIDLTPSTKKSRGINEYGVKILLEGLVLGLQKFDQMKHNSKRIKLLIQEIYDDLIAQESQNSQSNDDINIQILFKQLYDMQWISFRKWSNFPLNSSKIGYFQQLLQLIQIIYKFMQVIRTTNQDIFNLLQHKSQKENDIQSSQSYNLDQITKKSNNPSEHKSLLTQMLRDSSQLSNIDIQQNQFSSQIILKPKFRQYSQKQDLVFLDEHYRISTKSARPCSKSPILIRSEINYGDQHQKQNFVVRRKQLKAKKSQMGCSQCEIF